MLTRADRMPYRIDIQAPPAGALERLIDLGALDIEWSGLVLAAVMPDEVPRATIATTLGLPAVAASAAEGRDDDSVWRLSPRPVRAGGVEIVPAPLTAGAGAIVLADSLAFGTGLHPTTALCLEALAIEISASRPDSMLDVGTGSGVLALAALVQGVRQVTAIDIDPVAIAAASRNVDLNGVTHRVHLSVGDLSRVAGRWPLVAANVLTAPLIDMAPRLVQCVDHLGRLVLSGVQSSLVPEVERVYVRLGMRAVRRDHREGWAALVLAASW